MSIGPASFATSIINKGVDAVGGAAQSAASIGGNVKTEAAKTDSTGSSESVAAQRAANKTQDKNGAELIGMQSAATIQKQTTDVLNAIENGKQDSSNKAASALAGVAKGINF